jgi:3-mercaptopyruvate sulfurtransferase SseA
MIDFSTHPLVEAAWLAAHLSDADVCIVDARWRGDGTSRELYRRGHIPGAIHLDWFQDLSWTDARGVRNLLQPLEPFATVIEAAGISASLGLLALHLTGYRNVALYDASWEEWDTDPTFPVERERK